MSHIGSTRSSPVFQIENGRVTDGKEHFYSLHACDEFWS
jgi:hypothetical protein